MDDRIQPASVIQVRQMMNGRTIIIDDDVGGVALALKRVDKGFNLRWSDSAERFVVFHEDEHGQQRFITSAPECDHRLVHRCEKIAAADYDYGEEIDKIDREWDKIHDDNLMEAVGEKGERLAHALRKDLGVQKDVARSKKVRMKGITGHK